MIVVNYDYISLLRMISIVLSPASQEGCPVAQLYDAAEAMPNFKPNATKPHPQLTFMRGAPVNKCIEDLINRGLYPQKVRAPNMPNGVEWDNYDVVLRTFHATYCNMEGLSRSSDMAGLLLQYLFHGMFEWQTKDSKGRPVSRMKPIIFFIHKKMIGGRSRFATKV